MYSTSHHISHKFWGAFYLLETIGLCVQPGNNHSPWPGLAAGAVNHPRAEQPSCPPLPAPSAADRLYGISSARATLLSCQPLNQHQTGVTLYGEEPHFFLGMERDFWCCSIDPLTAISTRARITYLQPITFYFTGLFLTLPLLQWWVHSTGTTQFLNTHQIFHFVMGLWSPETFLHPRVTHQAANSATPSQWAGTKREDSYLGCSAWRRCEFTHRTGTTDHLNCSV